MKQSMLLILMGILWINFAFCQPGIIVFGSEDPLAVKKQIAQYLEYLDVRERIYLSVVFSKRIPEKLEGMTFCLNTPAPNVAPMIKVLIDVSLSKAKQQLVLAHEMIHVKQYAKRELILLNKQQVIWKGRKHYYQQANLQKAPWEREAYKNDNLLARRVKVQPEAPLVAFENQ